MDTLTDMTRLENRTQTLLTDIETHTHSLVNGRFTERETARHQLRADGRQG